MISRRRIKFVPNERGLLFRLNDGVASGIPITRIEKPSRLEIRSAGDTALEASARLGRGFFSISMLNVVKSYSNYNDLQD